MLAIQFNSIWDIINIPFGYVLRFFNNIFGGQYILTLLAFAVVVKVIMIPLSIKQQKSQIKGAMLKPKMAIIEKKYKGKTDPDSLKKKQTEMLELQQREGYSPLAGCLPLLIQFPVLIALYNIIRNPLTYICGISNDVVAQINNAAINAGVISGTAIENTTGVAWKTIKNLDQIGLVNFVNGNAAYTSEAWYSNLPSFDVFGGWLNLAVKPEIAFWKSQYPWLILVPIITVIFSFITMRLTKKYSGNLQAELSGQTPEQQKSTAIMEWIMPLMSVWISFMVSAALGVYWMFQSVIAIVQMVILNKFMPLPTFTEEEIKAYQKELKARPQPREFDENHPRPRSLHHIDDDE